MLLLTDKYWEDFAVGDKYHTGAVTVTETHMVLFAGLTGDYYPLHSNEEFAKTTPFGGRIIHGPLTFCLAVGLVAQSGIFGNSIIAFLGCDKLSLPAPVRPGDTISVEVEVASKRETSKKDRGVVTMNYVVKNAEGQCTMQAVMNFLMKRKC